MPISGIDPYSAVPQPPEYGVGVEDVEAAQPPEEEPQEEERPPEEVRETVETEVPRESYKGRYIDTYA